MNLCSEALDSSLRPTENDKSLALTKKGSEIILCQWETPINKLPISIRENNHNLRVAGGITNC